MEGLGLNLKGLLYQAGNFVVLFVILSVLFHKYFLGMIDSRTKDIKDSLDLAEKIKQDAEAAQQQQQALIEKARTEAGALLAEAQQQAKEMETRITDKAVARAESLLAQAAKNIERERQESKERLHDEITQLVIKTTEKVLGGQIPDSTKQEHISGLVKELS